MLFLIAAVALLLVSQVIIANRLVESSAKLRDLDRQIATLENANQLLSEKLRAEGSLSAVESKAKDLGFTKINRYSYLESPNPVASNFGSWKDSETR